MSLFDQVNSDIKDAMLAREKEKLEALRSIKAAFLVANSEKGAASELSDDAAIKIIQKLVKQRKDAAEIYQTNNRTDLYNKEILEAQVIEKYLPAQLTENEIETAIKLIIAQLGATGPQDMGKVMGLATKSFAGKADGKWVAQKVKDILAAL